ncbi:MAG: hypothetical protein AAF513_19305 [Pseudomonadota bacterium]
MRKVKVSASTRTTLRDMALLVLVLGLGFSDWADAAPDLSGTYNVATLTPLELPQRFGDALYLTPAEAKRISAQDAARKRSRNAASDPDREAPPEGGDGSAGAAGNVGGYNTFWIDNGENTFTVDGKIPTSIITSPKDGRRPQLTAAGRRWLAQRRKAFRENSGTAWWLEEEGPGPYDNIEQRPLPERCILGFGPVAGPPIFPTLYNNVKRIVQTPEHVMILAEMVHDARIIRLNAEHRPAHIRTWLGDSIGHWEGDTLVVETTNFNDQPALRGATRDLVVEERFRRDKNGMLIYSFKVMDDNVWTDSWEGTYPWPETPDKLYEYACHEGNYAMGNIMRGARLLEQEYLQETSSGDD